MANRFPGQGQTPNVRPPVETVIPTVMEGVNLPSPLGIGMQSPMFRPMHPSGGWASPHFQQPSLPGHGGFVPVAAASAGVLTQQQVGMQQQAGIHPQQQQRSIHNQQTVGGGKDRNYLQQQQKLRAMASSFKKPGPLSADSLIEDLLQQKETFTMRPLPSVVEVKASSAQAGIEKQKQQTSLESHRVSDLSHVEVSTVQGTSASLTPAPTLPLWLSPEAYDLLPAVYRHVWELTKVTTTDGRELVDTGRIFNILLTSGLPRDALGYIWNLANTIIPGVLTRPELNVALALVALAQTGWRNFTSSAVLSMVQQPPVPNLQLEPVISSTPVSQPVQQQNVPPTSTAFPEPIVTAPQQGAHLLTTTNASVKPAEAPKIVTPVLFESKSSSTTQTNSLLDDNDDFTDFQSAAPVPAPVTHLAQPELSKPSFFSPRDSPLGFNSFESPPASPVTTKPKGSREVGSRLANYSFGAPSSSNQPPNTKRNSTEIKDDLPVILPPKDDESMFPKCSIKPPPQDKSVSVGISNEAKDLPQISAMKTPEEDKYSALRDLSFDSALDTTEPEQKTAAQAASTLDDFGDFLSASSTVDDSFSELATREKPSVSIPAPIIEIASSEPPQEWNANFDSFSNASTNLWGEEQSGTSVFPSTAESTTSQTEEEEEDFGDFVGPSTISSLPHLNRVRETSTVTPDTQSVASLELGGFDNLSLGGAGPGSSPDGGLAELRGALEGVQWEAASAALQEEGREWRQCLHSCLALLQAAAQILGAIDDPHVADEVVTSREGEDYLANLLEVYCVTQRISAASHQLLPASRHSLEPLLGQVEVAWHTLAPFLERSNIEMQKDKKWNVSASNSSASCAICLILVDETEGSTALVQSGQHCYHAACANLWLNCVDTLLPTMAVP